MMESRVRLPGLSLGWLRCFAGRFCLCVLLCLSGVHSAFAQRDARVPDPDPELERKTFTVADGFEVNLFAADPLLAKPIQMNFDAAGRLWIAWSEAYPQIKPGQKQNDKIIVLEDTQGTGKAAKTATFCANVLELLPAVWRFAVTDGVEPTNNHAKRVLRRGVLWRKNAFGSQSAAGCRFVERMRTVVQTRRLQGRSVLRYLYEALVAQREGLQAPSLLATR